MKRLKLFAILTIISVYSSFGAGGNSTLWKISGNGLESPSYLFGTIHTICPDELVIPEKVNKALDNTEQLVLELDMDDPAFMQEMQKLSLNEGMKNISSELSEEDLSVLNSFLTKHYQTDMSQLGVLKPFALLSMMFIKGLECAEPGSYEMTLLKHASEKGWQTYGLETIQDQIGVFEQVSNEEQLSWLVKYASDEEEFRSNIDLLVKAYQEEKINHILELMTNYPEYKQIENALLYDRNKRWIEAIASRASEKPTFFAVGAAHLASDEGVIELLKEEGYKLTPIF